MTESNPILPTKDTQPKELQGNGKFISEVVHGGIDTWEKNGDQITNVYKQIFGNLYRRYGHNTDATKKLLERDLIALENHFLTTRTIGALLKLSSTGEIVGFTYGIPNHNVNYCMPPELDYEQRYKLKLKTIEVVTTGILEPHRDQRGWTMMLDTLDKAILETNSYTDVVRSAREDDGYNISLKKRYGNRVVYSTPSPYSTRFGPQEDIRIRLNPVPRE